MKRKQKKKERKRGKRKNQISLRELSLKSQIHTNDNGDIRHGVRAEDGPCTQSSLTFKILWVIAQTGGLIRGRDEKKSSHLIGRFALLGMKACKVATAWACSA